MSRTATIIVLSLILLSVVGGGFYMYSKNQKPDILFATATPFYTDIVKKTVATGSVVPRKEIEIKPQVSGIISKLYVQEGDVVKRGDLIASIEIVPDMVSLNNAENRMRRAQLALDNAQRELNRNKPLFEDGVISEMNFRQVELDFNNAKEEVEAAKDNLDLIRKGSTSRGGRSSLTNVRATAEGMILEIPVEEGFSVIEANNFNDGTTVAIVANMEDMVFEGKVDESEVGKLTVGMDLLLTVAAIDDESFDAKLEFIAPKGVEENGAIQFEIRAALGKMKDNFLRAEYSANADIVLQKRDSVLALPEGMLIFSGDSAFVEIERGPQRFEKIHVSTGLSDGINIEILGGITKDDRVKDANKTIVTGEESPEK
ncbi:MAG: efflux RND transporter periplasmic adaptor subunit [Bacteroidia bacterium]|nr:efflux RND transporter periplasmic adaptor subunit [Bacteroidia bacterium]